ncbi:MAG: 30S ribosomal protein S15 [Candidatus Nephrothrix sp. EaCA]|nr:MAG: 30S ribosomal protein S15 [Candidatus Nephrothrix sp. EaCA]
MHLTADDKKNLFAKHGFSKKATDTGSPESQVALLTTRIQHLTSHLEKKRKDVATELGLRKLVGKRRKLLKYLQARNISRYRTIIAELNIRK